MTIFKKDEPKREPGLEPVLEPGATKRRLPDAPDPIETHKLRDDTDAIEQVDPDESAPSGIEERELQPVSVKVFVASTGRRPEKAAGFLSHVRREAMKARTIPEWEKAWTEFMNRPVG